MYMFRHGSATRNAKFLTDAELRLMCGWSPNSKVPGRYIHLSGGDLDAKYLSVYGTGKPVEPPKPEFAPVICPRCNEKASPGMMFCPRYATPLDQAERARLSVREESTKKRRNLRSSGRASRSIFTAHLQRQARRNLRNDYP